VTVVDSHCHLDFPQFDADRAAVIARAAAQGVEVILAIGIGRGPAEMNAGLRMAALPPPDPATSWPRIFATVGVHPHEAKLAEEAHFAELERLARDPKVLAIGEIGLDFHYDHSPREMQERVFVRQMEVARGLRKPIVIHCREAWPECMSLLRERWRPAGLSGILHCFSGGAAVAREALDMGFYVSFAGNITFPKAAELRAVAEEIPLERLLVETDAPYLAPAPHRGRRNEPAFVVEVAAKLAEVRGLPVEEMARQTAANFHRLFGTGVN
jgi:TatD DNase family protein